ncbi:DUF1127 domain-containing protein [Paracoccaceae bacterium Fryx2]|nr:DUF1127 domain-containing protein [Paracoccaceae bacterium Fryx2]
MIRERIQAMIDQWRSLQEVSHLSDRELDDMGMTREQVVRFVRMPAAVPERMAKMAAVFGLTEAELQQAYAEYLDLMETCATCGARKVCVSALAHADDLEPADCGFCPNAAAYAEMGRVRVH